MFIRYMEFTLCSLACNISNHEEYYTYAYCKSIFENKIYSFYINTCVDMYYIKS